MSRTVTLIAAPLGGMQPGRPFDDWDQVPDEAREWAVQQADSDDENEMVTVLDGDQRANLGENWAVYVTEQN